jgi:hypothetical protein
LDKNGAQWSALREGQIDFSEKTQQLYSSELLNTVRGMLHTNPELRPSPLHLLQTFLQSPQEIELSMLREENSLLKDKMTKLDLFL